MRLWRLSAAVYAERLDGGYGFTNDGRWNSRGHPVTYCSTGPALCVLERLVHIQDAGLLPDETMLVSLDVPDGTAVEAIRLRSLPTDWRTDQRTTRLRGDAWLRTRSACLLSLPSAVVPVADSNDRNILINHLHPDVNGIVITRVDAFEYDARLFAFG